MSQSKPITRRLAKAARPQPMPDPRTFESEAIALQSLRLIAAPKPEDDYTDAELAAICADPGRSSELINHLIEFIKKI